MRYSLIFQLFLAISVGSSQEIKKINNLSSDYDLELVLVQALWRHGDRAPQYPYKNDKISEEDWEKIGSGIGQLTIEGLKQQYELGKAIRKRYIDEKKFLSKDFDKNLIKFRSTNRNRTILSAEANFLGMYPKQEFHFPIFVPKNYTSDCVNNVMCKCARREKLQKMARNLKEVRDLEEDPEVILLFNSLSILTGEKIDIENFWRIPDTFRCENRHFPQLLANLTPWFSQNLMEKLEELNTKINKFTSGIYSNPSFETGKKSIDISKEIAKLRSGPLITEIFQRMIRKLESRKDDLKYYAYSSHDMTLYAFLTAMGLQNITSSEIGGWPSYASAIFIELFVNKTDNNPFFKVIYRTPATQIFRNLTPLIPKCRGKSHCEMEIFQKIYEDLKIDLPVDKYCQVTNDLE